MPFWNQYTLTAVALLVYTHASDSASCPSYAVSVPTAVVLLTCPAPDTYFSVAVAIVLAVPVVTEGGEYIVVHEGVCMLP